MASMIANKSFPYSGRKVAAGTPFEAHDADVKLLRAAGQAREAEAVQGSIAAARRKTTGRPRKNSYKNRMMESE